MFTYKSLSLQEKCPRIEFTHNLYGLIIKTKEISNRMTSYISIQIASLTPKINEVFLSAEQKLENTHQSLIITVDETNLLHNIGTKLFIFEMETKFSERVFNSTKVEFSIMLAETLYSQLLYPYMR